MPNYIQNILLRFKYSLPSRRPHSPHAWNKYVYSRTPQMVISTDESPKFSPEGVLHVQQVVGILLYYALAADCTLLVALGNLAAVQTQSTEKTLDKVIWLLNYVASHPDAKITYVASDMCLHAHSDASYLSAPKAKSRAGGHFFLSNKQKKGDNPALFPINVPVHIIS